MHAMLLQFMWISLSQEAANYQQKSDRYVIRNDLAKVLLVSLLNVSGQTKALEVPRVWKYPIFNRDSTQHMFIVSIIEFTFRMNTAKNTDYMEKSFE